MRRTIAFARYVWITIFGSHWIRYWRWLGNRCPNCGGACPYACLNGGGKKLRQIDRWRMWGTGA